LRESVTLLRGYNKNAGKVKKPVRKKTKWRLAISNLDRGKGLNCVKYARVVGMEFEG